MVKVMEDFCGQQIGIIECPTCGADVKLKVNKNGTVFYRCDALTGREVKGKNRAGRMINERCYERHFYSRRGSKEIIKDYIEESKIGGLNHEQKTQDKILNNANEQPAATTAGDTSHGTAPTRGNVDIIGAAINWITG